MEAGVEEEEGAAAEVGAEQGEGEEVEAPALFFDDAETSAFCLLPSDPPSAAAPFVSLARLLFIAAVVAVVEVDDVVILFSFLSLGCLRLWLSLRVSAEFGLFVLAAPLGGRTSEVDWLFFAAGADDADADAPAAASPDSIPSVLRIHKVSNERLESLRVLLLLLLLLKLLLGDEKISRACVVDVDCGDDMADSAADDDNVKGQLQAGAPPPPSSDDDDIREVPLRCCRARATKAPVALLILGNATAFPVPPLFFFFGK